MLVRTALRCALPLALREDPLCLDPVRLLPAQVRLRGGHRLLGGLLLGLDLGRVRREAAAVPAHRSVAELSDPLHAFEQLAVVADHEEGPRPAAEHVVEPGPCGGVEVVGRLVEQQHVGAPQQQPGQPEPDHLASGELAEPPVEDRGGQAEPLELGHSPLLDVPLVAHGLEVGGDLAASPRPASSLRKARSAIPMSSTSSTREDRSRVRSWGR